ncbi:hypothetical protein B296_00029742 [Ensete ventricosum]|uniref:Uncharacterized protein n=1 Tax=Ensete ventricosum TaxID=4639 RepID=A0A426YEZ4_ENSVE|nr:hypothetical protein B296_00029742 [Ensete ventricosum]
MRLNWSRSSEGSFLLPEGKDMNGAWLAEAGLSPTPQDKYFATIMTWLKAVKGEDPGTKVVSHLRVEPGAHEQGREVDRLGFESGLKKMRRVSYEFGYRVALERLRGKHLEIAIEQDPFVKYPDDANVEMDLNQPFDDSTPSKK